MTSKSEASSMSSFESSCSSDESSCNSGSESFGLKTQQYGPIDPNKLFMIAFEYDTNKYEIDIPEEEMPALHAKAYEMSPLMIDHIAKGEKERIVTRRRRPKSGAKTRRSRARAIKAPKLLKQINKDLEEERGEAVYTWMFIAERKNSTYHYYLLSNKVKSRIEFGTKHFMLEKKYTDLMGKAPDRIYLTGEFHVTPGKIMYNFISGTYMYSKVQHFPSNKIDTAIEEKFTNALGEYFSGFEIIRTEDNMSFIPSITDKIITNKEWIYIQELFGPYLIPIKTIDKNHEQGITQATMKRIQKQQEEEMQKRIDEFLANMKKKK